MGPERRWVRPGAPRGAPPEAFEPEKKPAAWARRVAYPELLALERVRDVREEEALHDVEAYDGESTLRIEEKWLRQVGDFCFEFVQSTDPRDEHQAGWWRHEMDAILYMAGWDEAADAPKVALWIAPWEEFREWLMDRVRSAPGSCRLAWCVSGYGATVVGWVGWRVLGECPMVRRLL
jgi:hypothetical protein